MEHNQNYEFEKREVSKQGTAHILFSHMQEILVPERHPTSIWEVSFKILKFCKLKVYTVLLWMSYVQGIYGSLFNILVTVLV